VRSDPAARLRTACLALPPEAAGEGARGDPTFRVRDTTFAVAKRGDGRLLVRCKAPPGAQAVLVGSGPGRFFAPPCVGLKGWVGMRLDGGPDREEVALPVGRGCRSVVPKRPAALAGSGPRV
jgi:hypothetical protein